MNPSRPILLVVDDEPEVLRSIHDLFRMDYRVWTFTNPEEALERLAQEDVPVVMSDQRMPGISGVDFLSQVKKLRPDSTRLLFTGYSDIRAVIDAINQGNVFRYITKPWEPEELASTISQAMEYHDLVVSRRMLLEELQRSNRQLREANRVKSAFIEVASHELNTPVSVVLGLTELWKLTQAECSDEVTRSWIDRIHAAGKRLAGTVSRMLKLLQADQLGSPLSVKETDLAALVSDVVRDLEPFLEVRQQSVRIVLPGALEPVQIDPEKIADVLTNLLTNAIKFTPDGKQITVRVEPVSPDSVRVAVEDPGLGIRPEDREHLFQPFFTGFDTLHHSSGQFQYGKRGIGLGLMLIKTFVELHGGQVEEVRSEPERGSVFSFVLPREPKQRAPRLRPSALDAEPQPPAVSP